METGVLFSIHPKWCDLIFRGKKTCEVRKVAPTLTPPYTGYIYCTSSGKTLNIPITLEQLTEDVAVNGMKSMNCPIGNGKVVGEFRVLRHTFIQTGTDPDGRRHLYNTAFIGSTCLSDEALFKYLEPKGGKGWAIDFAGLKIYREPKTLADFVKPPCEKSTGCTGCKDWDGLRHICTRNCRITRPPQSWCYVWPAPF